MLKRFLSIFLSLLLLFTTVFVANSRVYAEEEDPDETIEIIDETQDLQDDVDEKDDDPADLTETDGPVPEENEVLPEETGEDEPDLPEGLRSESGYAAAILTDDGDLIFYRSDVQPVSGDEQTANIHGTVYTGTIFTDVENTSYPAWIGNPYVTKINSVYALDPIHPNNMAGWFKNCTQMTSFDARNFDTSNVTSMQETFFECASLTELDLSTFNNARVETFHSMFLCDDNVSKLRTLKLGSSFVTSSATMLTYMFRGCRNLGTLDLTGFDTRNVTWMMGMFENCSSLTSVDLSSFNLSSVDTSDMRGLAYMFKDASALYSLKLGIGWSKYYPYTSLVSGTWTHTGSGLTKSTADLMSGFPDNRNDWQGEWIRSTTAYAVLKENGDLVFFRSFQEDYTNGSTGDWNDVRGTTHIGKIFSGVEDTSNISPPWADEKDNIKNAYAIDTIRPLTMSYWFLYHSNLQTFDAKNFDTSKTEYMRSLFNDCTALTSIKNLDQFDTSKVKDMAYMFYNCKNLTSLDVSGFITSEVTDMTDMFSSCEKITSLDLSSFNTTKVTKMNSMFYCCKALSSLSIGSFNTAAVTDMSYMFYMCSSITSLNLSNFDTANVTAMNSMFERCSALESLNIAGFITANVTTMNSMFAGDSQLSSLNVSNFNTASVKYFSYMFNSCTNLTSLNVSNFDTSSAISMHSMFEDCRALTSLNISSFNTSNVTDMGFMFQNCRALTSLTLGSISTGTDCSFNSMFHNCFNLTSLDVSGFDTSEVTNMTCLFAGCQKLTSLDLSSFDTSKVTAMDSMFYNCPELASVKLGKKWTKWIENAYLPDGTWVNTAISKKLSSKELYEQYPANASKWAGEWKLSAAYAILLADGSGDLVFTRSLMVFNNGDYGTLIDLKDNSFTGRIFTNVESTPYGYDNKPWNDYLTHIEHVYAVDEIKPKNMYNWFYGATYLESFDSKNFDTSATVSMVQVFCDCEKLTDVDLTYFDTTNVQSMAGMFRSCRELTSLDLSSFDTKNTQNMEQMFYMCYSLEDLDLSSFDTSKVFNMANMFARCRSLTSLDLSHFDTGACEAMYDMFAECKSLEYLDVSSFDTSNVQSIYTMFYGCENLTSLDLSGFNTSKATNLSQMFTNCRKLTSLDLSSFDTRNVTDMQQMFFRCSSLKYLDLSSFDTRNTANMDDMLYGNDSLETIVLGPLMTRSFDGNYLSGTQWTNGSIVLSGSDLLDQYPGHASAWAGTWYLKGSDAGGIFGDISEADRDYKGILAPEDIPEGFWTAGIQRNNEYTGNAITQEFRVYHHKTLLKEGTDYTVKYANNTNAGKATITITGKGNYQGTLQEYFTIEKAQVNNDNLTIVLSKHAGTYFDGFGDVYLYKFNNSVQKPTVTVYFNGKKLKANTDYKVRYLKDDIPKDPKEPGMYAVAVDCFGNLTGVRYEYFKITEVPIVSTLPITLEYTKTEYDATPKKPTVTIKGISDLSPFTIEYFNNRKPGTAEVKITGNGTDYLGSVTKTFTITGTALSKAKITGLDTSYLYTGSQIKPMPTLTYNGTTLSFGSDYIIDYESNIEIGTAKLILIGNGGYTGTVTKTFKITGYAFNAKTVTVDSFTSAFDYSGAPNPQSAAELKYGTIPLVLETDYTVSYKNEVNAGTATVTYTGMGAYTGSFSKTYKINKGTITADSVTVNATYSYVNGGVKPLPVVKVNGKKLVANTDYTLSYKNNTKTGTATVTVKGKGNYEGTVSKNFTIITANSSGLKMTAKDKVESTKPAAMSTEITLTDRNGSKLKAGSDYDKNVVYTYAETTDVLDTLTNETVTRYAGDAVENTDIVPVLSKIRATVTLKGNYHGTVSKTFRIIKGDISKATITIPVQYYTGSPVTIDPSEIKVVLNNEKLNHITDFRIVSYTNNTNKGTATVTIEGNWEYGGSKTVKFTIAQKSMGITVHFNGNGADSGTMKDLLIYNGNTRLTANAFKRTGWKFDGWFDEDGHMYEDRGIFDRFDSFDPGTTVNLYAWWIEP